jgi:hypothetical protein
MGGEMIKSDLSKYYKYAVTIDQLLAEMIASIPPENRRPLNTKVAAGSRGVGGKPPSLEANGHAHKPPVVRRRKPPAANSSQVAMAAKNGQNTKRGRHGQP